MGKKMNEEMDKQKLDKPLEQEFNKQTTRKIEELGKFDEQTTRGTEELGKKNKNRQTV